MSSPNFNLLIALDALLAEGSVVGAANRLNLSPSAMSRALARLRKTTGDPLLVRAGRDLVPTPRAIELQDHVHRLAHEIEAVLRPAEELDLQNVERTFTLRTSDGFVENFGAEIIKLVRHTAPNIRLCFTQKTDKDSALLRKGLIDMETGVIESTTSPELRAQQLFKDKFVGVVRKGHVLNTQKVTASRYAAGEHVHFSRSGTEKGSIDDALHTLGFRRNVITIVGNFAAAITLAKNSDLIASVPERHTRNLRTDMFSFPLPVTTPQITVSLLWHPRFQADPVHQWVRKCIVSVCKD